MITSEALHVHTNFDDLGPFLRTRACFKKRCSYILTESYHCFVCFELCCGVSFFMFFVQAIIMLRERESLVEFLVFVIFFSLLRTGLTECCQSQQYFMNMDCRRSLQRLLSRKSSTQVPHEGGFHQEPYCMLSDYYFLLLKERKTTTE